MKISGYFEGNTELTKRNSVHTATTTAAANSATIIIITATTLGWEVETFRECLWRC